MVKNFKKISYIRGIGTKLASYRKRKKSLSSNYIISIVNGFKVYRYYMKMGNFESIFRLFILSLNFFEKKIMNDIFR